MAVPPQAAPQLWEEGLQPSYFRAHLDDRRTQTANSLRLGQRCSNDHMAAQPNSVYTLTSRTRWRNGVSLADSATDPTTLSPGKDVWPVG